MLSRSTLAIAASALAATATVVSILDHDIDFVPFFVGLTLAGGIGAPIVREPYTARRHALTGRPGSAG